MVSRKLIGYVFFFILLTGAFIGVWGLIAPFAGALALAAIVATICYPIFERVITITPKKSRGLASLFSVLIVITIVVTPLILLGSMVLKEAHSVYQLFSADSVFSLEATLQNVERFIQTLIPGFTIDFTSYVRQIAGFFASHIGAIFAGTASTIFYFFIALIALYYFFRDGREFTNYLIKLSPLPNAEDEKIIKRLAAAIRGVALGTVLVALIQGTLTAIGLSLFGFDRALYLQRYSSWFLVHIFRQLVLQYGGSLRSDSLTTSLDHTL
jgi:predicted PurR-regulated permease PerM